MRAHGLGESVRANRLRPPPWRPGARAAVFVLLLGRQRNLGIVWDHGSMSWGSPPLAAAVATGLAVNLVPGTRDLLRLGRPLRRPRARQARWRFWQAFWFALRQLPVAGHVLVPVYR